MVWVIVWLFLVIGSSCSSPTSIPTGSLIVGVSTSTNTVTAAQRVTVRIQSDSLSSPIVKDLNSVNNQWKAVLSGIPLEDNATVVVQAFGDTSGTQRLYEAVIPNVTLKSDVPTVLVVFLRASPKDSKKAESPRLLAMMASTHTASPGETVSVRALMDSSQTSSTPLWTSEQGKLSQTSGLTTVWTAPSKPGPALIYVEVKDSNGASQRASLSIDVQSHFKANKPLENVSYNSWPILSKLSVASESVQAGQTVSLQAIAKDLETRSLLYQWSSNCGGAFASNSADTSTFQAPDVVPDAGLCVLSLKAWDEHGGHDSSQVQIKVIPKQTSPAFLSTQQSKEKIGNGETITFLVKTKAANERLTFSWTEPQGAAGVFETPKSTKSGSQVVWKASPERCSSTIRVTAMDSANSGALAYHDFKVSCECKQPLTNCSTACADLMSSPSHCGACHKACSLGWICQKGACVIKSRVSTVQSSGREHGFSTAVDKDNNVYVTGVLFASSAPYVFGSTSLTVKGGSDIFVAKLNSQGKWLWAKRFGGVDNLAADYAKEEGRTIVTDPDGNVYVGAHFAGTMVIGSTTLTSMGGIKIDLFVAKLSPEGKLLWFNTGGGEQADAMTTIAVDKDRNVYVSAAVTATLSPQKFGNLTIAQPRQTSFDVAKAKLNNEGKWQWVRTYYSIPNDYGGGIDAAPDGTTYSTGNFSQTVQFGGVRLASANGGRISYIARHDKQGNVVWAKKIDTVGGWSSGHKVVLVGDHIYVSGVFSGFAVIGSTTLQAKGNTDVYVAKYSTTGTLHWIRGVGGPDRDSTGGITYSNGHIYVAGLFGGSVTFGETTLTAKGPSDGFVAKYSPDGTLVAAVQYGGPGNEYSSDIVSKDGQLYVSGFFSRPGSFGNVTVVGAPTSESVYVVGFSF